MNTMKRAEELLKGVQWKYRPYDEHWHIESGYCCPECGGKENDGHAENCELLAVITELESMAQAEPDGWKHELLDLVSACQSAYHIDNTPGHRFGGLGSNLEENRTAVVEYVEALLSCAPQPSVPPGWKLVPVEPTSKMIVAGAEADPQFFTHAQFVYRAMLAAAPEKKGGAA